MKSRDSRPVQKRLLLSAVSNWLAFAATLLVSFFLTPYMIRRLGAGPYGIWAFVESLLAYLTLFDLGIAACVVRYVAKYQHTESEAKLRGLLSTTWFLFLGLGLAAGLVGLAVIPWSVRGMTSSGVPTWEAVAFGLLMLANLAMTLPLSTFPAMLDGLERYGTKSIIRFVMLVMRTTALMIVLEQGGTLWHVGVIVSVTNVIEHVAFAIIARRLLPVVRFCWADVNRESFQEIRGYSFNAFLAMIAGRVTVQSGTLIVGAIMGMSAVTAFAIVLRLVELAKSLLRQAITTLTPAVSSLDAAGKHEQLRLMFLNATRWVLYLIIPIQLGFGVFGDRFLLLWLHDPIYPATCYWPLIVLSLPLTISMAQSVAARILYGTGHLSRFARMSLLEAAINIGLSILLCHQFGLIGLVWGIAVPNLLMNLWTIHTARQQLLITWASYLKIAGAKPLLCAAIPILVWWPLMTQVNSWLSLISVGIAGMLPYGMTIMTIEIRWKRQAIPEPAELCHV